jgi:hypothetical protein
MSSSQESTQWIMHEKQLFNSPDCLQKNDKLDNSHIKVFIQDCHNMKVLITGGTGTIGKQALHHVLLRPEITSVIAISRRELPADVSNNPKLKVLILKDFSNWPADALQEVKDADAMIW